MDSLRVEAEDNFLLFLPRELRLGLRKSWTLGFLAELKMKQENPFRGADRGTLVQFPPNADPVIDLLEQVLTKRLSPAARGGIDPINPLVGPRPFSQPAIGAIPTEQALDQAFGQISTRHGPFVRVMPDVTFLRVRRQGADDLTYTIVRNRDHLNVSFILTENISLNPDKDTLHVFKGFVGSYPNFFFVLSMEDAASFIRDLVALKENDGSFGALVSKYGVRRRDPRLWSTLDWFHHRYHASRPLRAGLFDINRYRNY
jgi:hypothetical protein